MKNFADLTEREVLAVAISSEEEDSRIYMSFAEDLAERYPDSAKMFEEMAEEERGHRHRLLELYEQRFGDASAADPPRGRQGIPAAPPDLADQEPVARHHPQGSRDDGARRPSNSTSRPPSRPRTSACAACSAISPKRKRATRSSRSKLTDEILSPDVRAEEDKTRRRMFVLQYVQPGLAGLMDGSVSTLAPLFAAAFATHQNWQTFLVGLAASIGAGISMGFAEALSDDGSLTGRGSPWLRGIDLRVDDDARRPRPHHALSGAG